MDSGIVLSTFTPRITMSGKRLCAFLRRLIGRSPVLQPTEIRATLRGELIDLVNDEASQKLIDSQQTLAPVPAQTLAPKPVQKPEPRPMPTPVIKPATKKPKYYGGRANYPMRQRGNRRK